MEENKDFKVSVDMPFSPQSSPTRSPRLLLLTKGFKVEENHQWWMRFKLGNTWVTFTHKNP